MTTTDSTTKTVDVHVRMAPAEAALMDAICSRPDQPRLSRSQVLRWGLRELAKAQGVEGVGEG